MLDRILLRQCRPCRSGFTGLNVRECRSDTGYILLYAIKVFMACDSVIHVAKMLQTCSSILWNLTILHPAVLLCYEALDCLQMLLVLEADIEALALSSFRCRSSRPSLQHLSAFLDSTSNTIVYVRCKTLSLVSIWLLCVDRSASTYS